MKKGSVPAGMLFLALGIFVCHQAIRLSLGQTSRPGPGFVPFGLGFFLILLSLLYLIPALRAVGGEGRPQAPPGFGRTLLAAGILCFFTIGLNGLGYLISTFILFLLWLKLVERKKWLISLGLACLAVVLVYYFNLLFSVQLPKGLIQGL